jgi:hypothetical protein
VGILMLWVVGMAGLHRQSLDFGIGGRLASTT